MISVELFPLFTSTILLFAILSLTFVRMLPVAVAMLGRRLKPATVLFMGWFGPRGLASTVLGLIFLEQETHLIYDNTIIAAVAATVLISIFAHGVSAVPGIKWYARQGDKLDDNAPELQDTVALTPGGKI